MAEKLILALALLAQDPDQAISKFRESKSADEAARASAVSTLALCRHEKVLKVLIQTLAQEESALVREACVQALQQYADSEDAAQALVDQLTKIRKSKHRDSLSGLAEKCIEAFSMLHRSVTRKRVAVIHDYFDDSNLALVVRAVQATGRIRDKSSIPALLELMRTTQREIKQLIQKERALDAAGT